MPDLTLSFMNPRLFDDVSFHPCVRFKRWEAERLLSFIPPDGNFRLMSYHISSQSVVAIPIYIRHNFSIKTGEQGRLDLTIGPRNTLGRTVDKVKLELTLPRCVLNCLLTPNQGKYTFDSVSKTLSWDVGRIDVSKLPNIRGTVSRRGREGISSAKADSLFPFYRSPSRRAAPTSMRIHRSMCNSKSHSLPSPG